MKKSLAGVIILTVLLINISSCKKKEDTLVNTPTTDNPPVIPKGTYTNLQAIFKDYIPAAKEVKFDASQGIVFFGNSGTRYSLPADAYISAAGYNVTGEITATATEYLKKSDMIFGGVMPVSNNEMLESGGQASITLTQNGQVVFMKLGSAFSATVPQDSTPIIGMQLFRGVATGIPASTVNWTRADTVTQVSTIIYPGGDSIQMITDSFGFINIDRFRTEQKVNSTMIRLAGVTINTNSDLRAYFSVNGTKSLMWLPVKSENTITLTNVPKLPGTVIIMGVINGDFYAALKPVTPAEGLMLNVLLEKQSFADFRTQVAALK